MRYAWAWAVALTVAAPALAAAPGWLPYEKTTLPTNGLEVIFSEDHSLPVVAVNLWYHAGPINEPPRRTGFAHLFEHLMFQGSLHVGDDQHFKLLESRGGTEINGTTGFDRTNYLQTVPAGDLELALWLESDRMGFLLEPLTQAKLDLQREVVLNEKAQSIDNAPYGPSREKLVQLLFPPGHPYHGAVIGSMQDLKAATLDDVRDFYQRYYAPANATLVIAGDFDATHARQLVERYFATLPARQRPAKTSIKTPAITQQQRAEVDEPVSLAQVAMAWHTPPAFAAQDADCDLIAQILAGGDSSRLYQKLVYQQQLAQDVACAQDSQALVSTLSVVATAAPGVQVARLEAALVAEVEQLRAQPPSDQEVLRAKNSMRTALVSELQKVGGFTGRADMLNRYNQYLGTPDFFAQDLDRYAAVSAQSVHAAARKLLGPQACAVVVTVPRAK